MGIEEIEKVAEAALHDDAALEERGYHPNALTLMHRKPTRDIARALLAVAPFVRAASAERDEHIYTCACRLCAAYDTMRAELGKEGK